MKNKESSKINKLLQKKLIPWEMTHHSHRNFIIREDLLTQEDQMTILRNTVIYMSIDPLDRIPFSPQEWHWRCHLDLTVEEAD